MILKWMTPKGDDTQRDAVALMQMIDRTQAMIQFKPDGTILTANKNFLAALGYTLDEIQGKHHAIFVDPDEAASPAYAAFWARLRAGEPVTGEVERFTKSGKSIWIQATYAAILDETGKVERVIKVATDVTARRAAIGKIANGLHALEDGNLTHRIAPTGEADIDLISSAFNSAVDRLEMTMQTITQVSHTLSDTIQEVTTSSGELSDRSGRQAATLEETYAAIKDLAGSAAAASDAAQTANQIIRTAKSSAAHSETVVTKSVDAMHGLTQSSQKISSIIGVIEDISFQTNLLALNAGVEAARAGDRGSGFAVVASEVRSLAQRSQTASTEIKSLIADSTQQVAEGVALVNDVGAELKNIIARVSEIATEISGLSTSAQEQSTTLQHINDSVGALDSVTQQNAAMAQKITQANAMLTDNMGQMIEGVNYFASTGPGQRAVRSAA